jgi:hypothetical protein
MSKPGSAKSARTSGSRASACPRRSATAPLRPHSIVWTKRRVHTCDDAAMAPVAPITTSGKRKASSPPSIANRPAAPASTESVSTSIPPTGPVRDVVDDQRYRRALGDDLEVAHDRLLAGTDVVGDDGERRSNAGHGGQRLVPGDRRARVVRARADHQCRAGLGADTRDGRHDGPALAVVQHVGLTGGGERDDAACAVSDHAGGQLLEASEVDVPVGAERRHHRDEDPGGAKVARHGSPMLRGMR